MTHKPWCTGGFDIGPAIHVCTTDPQTFAQPDDFAEVQFCLLAYPGEAAPRVHLNLENPATDDDATSQAAEAFLTAEQARGLAESLLFLAMKAESLTEHNHVVGGGDVYFPDCLACRRTARLAALAGQKPKGITE